MKHLCESLSKNIGTVDTIIHGDILDGDKGTDVQCSSPRVLAWISNTHIHLFHEPITSRPCCGTPLTRVFAHVNKGEGLLGGVQCPLHHVLRGPDKGVNRSVGGGSRVHVQQAAPWGVPDRCSNGIDDLKREKKKHWRKDKKVHFRDLKFFFLEEGSKTQDGQLSYFKKSGHHQINTENMEYKWTECFTSWFRPSEKFGTHSTSRAMAPEWVTTSRSTGQSYGPKKAKNPRQQPWIINSCAAGLYVGQLAVFVVTLVDRRVVFSLSVDETKLHFSSARGRALSRLWTHSSRSPSTWFHPSHMLNILSLWGLQLLSKISLVTYCQLEWKLFSIKCWHVTCHQHFHWLNHSAIYDFYI